MTSFWSVSRRRKVAWPQIGNWSRLVSRRARSGTSRSHWDLRRGPVVSLAVSAQQPGNESGNHRRKVFAKKELRRRLGRLSQFSLKPAPRPPLPNQRLGPGATAARRSETRETVIIPDRAAGHGIGWMPPPEHPRQGCQDGAGNQDGVSVEFYLALPGASPTAFMAGLGLLGPGVLLELRLGQRLLGV